MAQNAPAGLGLPSGSLPSLSDGSHDFLCAHPGTHRRHIKGRSLTSARPKDVLTPVTPANPNLSLLSGLIQQVSKILTGL
jgi:hypothetical protein